MRFLPLLATCWLFCCNAFAQAISIYKSPDEVPRQVVLYVSLNTGVQAGVSPWTLAADALNKEGIALVVADASALTRQRSVVNLSTVEVAAVIRTAVRETQQAFPGLPVQLAGFGAGSGLLLDAVADIREVDRVMIASGDFRNNRLSNWAGYKHPVMLLHAPGAQCDSAPWLEAEQVARNNQFVLVPVGYNKMDSNAQCGRGSQHVFSKLEVEFANVVARWLGGSVPARAGWPNPEVAWREQVVFYTVEDTFVKLKLEMTVMFPRGKGPFPVAAFNHGDIEVDSSYMRYKARYVNRIVAREFLHQGWAVAFPTRRGVGLSEGTYPLQNFARGDGDATYKAREHTKDILPAMEYLKSMAGIDGRHLLITGQSAGGYATMHIAALNLPEVTGAVNFSGGRTIGTEGKFNTMMVRGFGEFGAMTKVPMLWVFAENDSRYSADTIRASHMAFTEAGGKAKLLLSPPVEGDGHFVYRKPEIWREALRTYLAERVAEWAKAQD